MNAEPDRGSGADEGVRPTTVVQEIFIASDGPKDHSGLLTRAAQKSGRRFRRGY